MSKVSAAALLAGLMLSGCASLPQDSQAWARFVEQTSSLSPSGLNQALVQSAERYQREPTDAHGIQLAYLLTRPTASGPELAQSVAIASALDPREYALIQALLLREAHLIDTLRTSQLQVDLLSEQLTALQTQLDLLNLAEVQRAAELEQVDTLRAQLDAIKTIEADMAKDKQTIEELSE